MRHGRINVAKLPQHALIELKSIEDQREYYSHSSTLVVRGHGSILRVHSYLPCPFLSPPGSLSGEMPRGRRRLPKILSFTAYS